MDNIEKKSILELDKELTLKLIAMRDTRFESSGSKSKNVREYGNLKKDVARLKTAIRKLALTK